MRTAEPFLDADQLRKATFVRHVEIYDRLGSTNDRAAQLARELPADELPALVVARRQMAGRGRGQHTWWSADGSLTFSLLVEPQTAGILPANWPQLSLTTAVALCDALRGETPNAKLGIKWPNDVLVDGGKVAGILIESPGGGAPAKDRLIIGTGINVNNSWHDAPEDAGGWGAALCDLSGRQHNLPSILTNVLCSIEKRINQLSTHDVALPRAWQQLNLLARRRVVAEVDGRRIEGECAEIAGDGTIVLNTASGQQRLFSGSLRLLD